MDDTEAKAQLKQYLRSARDAMLGKLTGLSEYDIRRPLTPTGTNLLGLVKHVTSVEMGYLGFVFGRPFPDSPNWHEIGPNADMWATPDESRQYVIDLHRQVSAHADATIDALDLDTTGFVPWWQEGYQHPSLHKVLVHVTTEIHRHAGHADIVRELIDGLDGLTASHANVPSVDESWWRDYHQQVEDAAKQAAGEA